MSYHVTAIVRRARLPKTMRQRPEVKAVALALADRAYDDGGNAWPSVATIAAEAEISTRTCDKCLKTLLDAGLILEQAPPGQWRPRTYRLDLDAWTMLDPKWQAAQFAADTQPAATLNRSASQSVAGLNPSDTHTVAGLSKVDSSDPQLSQSDPQPSQSDPQLLRSDPQWVAHDPVLNSPLNGYLNKSAHEEKQKRNFETVKEIAKRCLDAENGFNHAHGVTLATIKTMDECRRLSIDTSLAERAVAHWVSLHQLRNRFGAAGKANSRAAR
jgi:hypothetical protein